MINNIIQCINNNSGVLSVIFSVIAVIVAIIVPSIIANNQKKIALYNERLKVYEALEFIVGFCDAIKNTEVYDRYKDDLERLKQYTFTTWVLCLRTKYSDAWRIKFNSSPQKKSIVFTGETKEMEMICYIHLKNQYEDLKKAKYVFSKSIEQQVKDITLLYFDIINKAKAYVFYSDKKEETWDLYKLLQLVDDFSNSTESYIIKKLKLK